MILDQFRLSDLHSVHTVINCSMVYAKLSPDFTKRHASITEAVHVPNSNVVDISRVAGHKNLKTTQRYIHTADERRMKRWPS